LRFSFSRKLSAALDAGQRLVRDAAEATRTGFGEAVRVIAAP
jgi:hypothetical protein